MNLWTPTKIYRNKPQNVVILQVGSINFNTNSVLSFNTDDVLITTGVAKL